ncbi:Guanine nucleotide-binding protein alpha-5 subunit [Trichostrongylus colubriformis]
MGARLCGLWKESGDQAKSRQIDSELRKEHVSERKRMKILLLGSADSGKSTIVKQMRLIHAAGFNETEAIDAIFVIRKNIVDSFHAIAVGIEQTNVDIPEKEKGIVEQFSRHSSELEIVDEEDELQLLMHFSTLDSVKSFLAQHATWATIPDNYTYFSTCLQRILAKDYLPTSLDIVHMRKATIGVHEFAFDFKKYAMRLIDVGGQRTERRKWIHFFEDVTAVMFVSSLSSYDQIMEEDMAIRQVVPSDTQPRQGVIRIATATQRERKNRLVDSIDLFHEIIKNEFLKSSSFILFLNKVDLFKAKLLHSRLGDHFSSYTGNNDFESASEYIQNFFTKAPLPSDCKLYVHFTEATDTQQIDFVFAAACDIILQLNLTRAGMQ